MGTRGRALQCCRTLGGVLVKVRLGLECPGVERHLRAECSFMKQKKGAHAGSLSPSARSDGTQNHSAGLAADANSGSRGRRAFGAGTADRNMNRV